MMLYALGAYTPAFHLMYELPFVALYRRAADATFVFCALLAIVAGYLVHRWLSGTVPPRDAAAARARNRRRGSADRNRVRDRRHGGRHRAAIVPVATALAFSGAAIAVAGAGTPCRSAECRLPPSRCWRCSWPATCAGTTRRMNRRRCRGIASTRCARTPPTRPSHMLKERLAAAAAPDRRDRVEMIGVGYHWPNLGLAQGFDHVFGHNPLRLRWFYEATRVGDTVALGSQRQFSPLYPSYRSAFADLFGVRFIATGVPIEQIDTSLKPGDLQARRPHRRGLHLREPARAAARDAVHRLAAGRFRRPDPQRLAGCRSGPHRAAQARAAPASRGCRAARPEPRAWCATPTPR